MRRPVCNHSRPAMAERRSEKRLLCSDLVKIRWTGMGGESREEIAIMEDVSPLGASLFTGVPVPEGAALILLTPAMQSHGEVRHCATVANGFSVGVRLSAARCWLTGMDYTPEHLLDLSQLDFSMGE